MRTLNAIILAAGATALIAAASGRMASGNAPAVPEEVRALVKSHCAGCHKGAFAPKQLKLGTDALPASVVGVASKEKPDLMLVAPGSPETSYLVLKVKGSEGISGKRMPPPPKTPLMEEEIALIGEWIKSLE